ncbi:G2/M phase-specific E3 ubiquitin-protein ligase [Dissostichus eleginoides]|uniref:G2/M phase-specific E3 ubiquitin-protein ligase n=1 Tax=Dissostichus eleginoides TaxID=100907 RepID=A0AAD9C6R2_DISEL|nr:G2/M phase-specific E3 ubiquitin-protein ligase [Dissostichus eleginoides]
MRHTVTCSSWPGEWWGHSFVHGGPCLSGLSPAVVHVLLGGSPETATVTLEDCPDLNIRATIRLLEGESELSDEGKRSVRDLAFAWDLPCLTGNNRRWLFEKMLIHAVIGRVIRQIKQLRRGLKETPMWAMLNQRPDTVALLFPQEGAVDYSPAVILQRITWPRDDDEDDDCSVDTKCRVSGYLRRFIENASPDVITNLVKFWTGWEILPRNNLSIEVVNGRFPTASTCYETLRIPGHYKDYASFENDMLACIGTCQTGFGLV